MNKITIFTDTTCDLDLDYLNSIGVKYLPLTIEINEVLYKDRIDISPSEFYNKTNEKNVYPKTSLVSPQDFEDIFKKELELGNEVICITISSGLSGTYNAAVLAKNNIDSDKIHIVDSRTGSVGIGMIVIEAAKLAKQSYTASEIIDRLDSLIAKQSSYIYIENIEMLKRNGRIPSALATIGSILGIKPILNIKEGRLDVLSKLRGQKQAFKYMLDAILNTPLNLNYPIMIAHADNIDYAEFLKSKILEKHKNAEFIISEAGPAIGSHSGRDAVALWFVTQ